MVAAAFGETLMTQPTIRLWDAPGLGLVILFPSGVVYSNQVGGHACLTPTIEGVYVPLVDEVQDHEKTLIEFFTGPYWNGWCCDGIDEPTADFIDGVLSRSLSTRFLRVDRTRLQDSCEAWVYVELSEQPPECFSFIDGKQARTISGKSVNLTDDKDLPVPPEHNLVYGFGKCGGVLTWTNSD